MPQILPDNWQALACSGETPGEYETLKRLSAQLPDHLTVFHSLRWTLPLPNGSTQWGEIDFCVLHPSGKLLVIEQKNGGLLETGQGLVKRYGDTEKNVGWQMRRSIDGLREKFRRTCKGAPPLVVDYLLYCPDHRLQAVNAVGLDRKHIVDAGSRDKLPEIIDKLLQGEANPAQFDRLFRFFCDELRLVPDIGALDSQQTRYYEERAGGLAEMVGQLDFSPFRLCVRGTAGSGKTQAAVAEFRRARKKDESVLLTCFNRPLADHLAQMLGEEGTEQVATLHQTCLRIATRLGLDTPDFAAGNAAWEALLAQMLAREMPAECQVQTLIVDEGQDFSAAWAAFADRLLVPNGRLLWLEDMRQSLYAQPGEAAQEGADFRQRHPQGVVLHALRNFRNPASVIQALRDLLGISPDEMRPANPAAGLPVGLHIYRDAGELRALAERCLKDLRQAGFSPAQVALISWQGQKHAETLSWPELGGLPLRRYTGEYDENRRQVMTEGKLLAETLFRFKGRHAPAVILTEIDFPELKPAIANRLFCGMTRPTLKLDLLLSERAAQALAAALPQDVSDRD
ncbi:MAG: NERD domain-containing protein [Zoogloeaceae bacterium]|jgi:hypothetical protein|nr:NERD domain-containing protein [Zoogloeaceae bacterium]